MVGTVKDRSTMADKIAVSNNTKGIWWVAGQMVPAGETRHFDLEQVPEHMRPKADTPAVVEPAEPDPIGELQAKSINDVMEMVPALTDAELVQLREREAAVLSPRTTLLAKLDKEVLDRAAVNSGAGDGGT